MTFEEITKDYLIVLKQQGVIVSANIMCVDETFKISSCIGSFLENNIVVQKSICVFDDDGIVVWKDLTPLNINNPII
jgi:hypothetical protein